jgi:hypothetical protein
MPVSVSGLALLTSIQYNVLQAQQTSEQNAKIVSISSQEAQIGHTSDAQTLASLTCDVIRALYDQLHLVFCYLRVLHNGLLAYGLRNMEPALLYQVQQAVIAQRNTL